MRRINFSFVDQHQKGLIKFTKSTENNVDNSTSFEETKLLRQEPPMSDIDEVIMLLHTVAEIEHSLLTQYLYSGYTLATTSYPEASGILLQIAREEMGHLMSIQNILTLLGAPLNFEREDYPFNQFYPFQFALEPFSVKSVAKYVLAEMPMENQIPAELGFNYDQIKKDAGVNTNETVNRVGALFNLLIELVEKLPDHYFIQTTINKQASKTDWSSDHFNLILRAVQSNSEVVLLLKDIAEQGEGYEIPSEIDQSSHFMRFFNLYKFASSSPADTLPNNLPINPTIKISINGEDNFISNKIARDWCHLFNMRYRILLAQFNHYLNQDSSVQPGKKRKLRLKNWALEEMRTCLKNVAVEIFSIPQHEPPQTVNGKVLLAAPTFDLPYTLNMPSEENDRWRYQLHLIESSIDIINNMLIILPNHQVLIEIRDIDESRKQFINEQISN